MFSSNTFFALLSFTPSPPDKPHLMWTWIWIPHSHVWFNFQGTMCLFPHVLDSAGLGSDNKSLSLALCSHSLCLGLICHPSPLFLDEGLQMSVYSKSYVALQDPQWTHLPACVSMETQFVHVPLQLVSLTSISAEGHLAWAHTYTESQPQRWEKIVRGDLRAWDLSETALQDCGKLCGVMAFIWILGHCQNKQKKDSWD